MKCPSCHGTGQVPNRTRYRVEVAEENGQWYQRNGFGRSSTTNFKEAVNLFTGMTFAGENSNPTSCFHYSRARVISISAKGRRRTLMEKRLNKFTALDRIEVKGEHNERADTGNSTEVEG